MTAEIMRQHRLSQKYCEQLQYCVICLRLACIEDGWIIEQINRMSGRTVEERLRNYLYQVCAPDSISGEAVMLDRTIRRGGQA